MNGRFGTSATGHRDIRSVVFRKDISDVMHARTPSTHTIESSSIRFCRLGSVRFGTCKAVTHSAQWRQCFVPGLWRSCFEEAPWSVAAIAENRSLTTPRTVISKTGVTT